MKSIIYAYQGSLSILVPTGALPVDDVARKDVPPGVPFRIVDASEIPSDRSERDRWVADFSNPDGYGIGPDAWFAEQEANNVSDND